MTRVVITNLGQPATLELAVPGAVVGYDLGEGQGCSVLDLEILVELDVLLARFSAINHVAP